jgi:methyltransferase
MVISRSAYLAILGLIAIERLIEIVISRRNAAILLRRGALEAGKGHFAPMVVFHVLFLVAPAAEMLIFNRPFPGLIGWGALVGAATAQALRYWTILTLGERWNIRVLAIPGETPIATGPYRFVRHPNYLAVAIEVASVPCVHGCWLTAIVFSIGNAALMAVRIRSEERVQGANYSEVFERVPRILPAVLFRSRTTGS